MAETVEAEVIPPGNQRPVRQLNVGFVHRPGFALFVTGVLTGMLVAGAAVYLIKKKL